MKKAIIIGGPTASGKSKFALELAKALNGEVINADSVQCYKDIATLAAAPTSEAMEECPHHLYCYKDYYDESSVGIWLDDIRHKLYSLDKHNKLPVIVGGTGMYLNALLEGLANIPDSSRESKEIVKELQTRGGLEELYNKLIDIDPDAAGNISPNDSQRIKRALEVNFTTGYNIGQWHSNNAPPLLEGYEVEIIVLHPERNFLRATCDARFIEILNTGAIEEVEFLMHREIPKNSQINKAIGFQEIEEYLIGDKSLNQAIEDAQTKTKQYAKRQLTWFRNKMPGQKTLYFSTQDELKQHIDLFIENNKDNYL
jgi:tRNA dimethylallyltransferase